MKALAFTVLLFTLAPFASAQLSESTTVEVIQVPVYVIAHGAAVSNLTRDNFRLFVNGKPQAIDYFDVVDFTTVAADANRDPRQRRLYVLMFDLMFSSPNALHRAQKAAERIIEAGEAIDTFAIATLSMDNGADVIVPFTRDRQALLRAVANLRPSRMNDPLRLALTPAERAGVISGRGLYGGSMGDVDGLDEHEREMVRDAIEDAVGDLADLAVRLEPLEGVKHVVLLSSGFDASLIHGVQALDPRQRPTMNFGSRLIDAVRKMNQTFTGASVFLDAIDIGGLRPFQRVFDNEVLYTLTRETGGAVIDRSNDLAGGMQALVKQQRVVYLLSFRAPERRRDENTISVSLTGAPSGARASYRRSFRSEPDPPDSGDPLRLADIVMNDIPQTGVTTKLHVEPSAGKAETDVEVSAGELAGQTGGMTVTGEVLLYVFSGPKAVAFTRKEMTIEPRAMAALAGTPVRLAQSFDLPPGNYTAKVLVRFPVNGALGFARSEFSVPPP